MSVTTVLPLLSFLVVTVVAVVVVMVVADDCGNGGSPLLPSCVTSDA